MNITLRTPDFELEIKDAAHEEALDALALLINTGVVPATDEWYDIEEEDCDGFCDCDCDDEDEEEEELSEEEQVIEFLQGLEAALQEAFAEAAEAEKAEEKEKEKAEPEQLSFEDVFNLFFGQQQKK